MEAVGQGIRYEQRISDDLENGSGSSPENIPEAPFEGMVESLENLYDRGDPASAIVSIDSLALEARAIADSGNLEEATRAVGAVRAILDALVAGEGNAAARAELIEAATGFITDLERDIDNIALTPGFKRAGVELSQVQERVLTTQEAYDKIELATEGESFYTDFNRGAVLLAMAKTMEGDNIPHSAIVSAFAKIDPGAVIGRRVRILYGAVVKGKVVIRNRVEVGKGATLNRGVVVPEGSLIPSRSKVSMMDIGGKKVCVAKLPNGSMRAFSGSNITADRGVEIHKDPEGRLFIPAADEIRNTDSIGSTSAKGSKFALVA